MIMQLNGQLILYAIDNETIWNVTWAPRCSFLPTFKTSGANLHTGEDCRLRVFRHWILPLDFKCPKPFPHAGCHKFCSGTYGRPNVADGFDPTSCYGSYCTGHLFTSDTPMQQIDETARLLQ
ncbi:hypothetical protein BV898_04194 [Hypsibius exemplaris]|uniref:Bulb-type lectin domain-containing protein n=1 Tax=Hypsibius exemplaris TaxID=2072580 RepID=A0A1W0X3B3_HYPEX|nr:hypothetical protein BV898_04194 [Hypsibius exemplaris]